MKSIMTKALLGGFVLLALTLVGPVAASTWIDLASTGGPPPLTGYAPTVVRDPATNRLILFGRNSSMQNEVWVLTNANGLGGTPAWTRLSPTGTAPPNRGNHAAVYDPANNRMIIFGGCGGTCYPVLKDVWVLTNANGLGGAPQWIPLSPIGTAPAARHAVAAGYEPATNRLVIFGGHTGSGDGGTTYSDVWVLSHANGLGGSPAWTQLSPAGGPPPGQYAPSFVYDAGNNRLTVSGGSAQGSGSLTNAVWVLSNANGSTGSPVWTNLIAEGAAGSPSPFRGGGASYDTAYNRMMLVLSPGAWVATNANGLGGSANWMQLTPSGGPPSGGAAGSNSAVYDPASNRATVIFYTAASTLEDWVLTDANGVATVAIDIKPGSDVNPINPDSQGRIAVAILSTDTFDATQVDTSTVHFGTANVVTATIEDVNGDGRPDMVLHFNTTDVGIACGDASATLTGTSLSGQLIQGSDSIRTVGCK